MLHEYGEFGGVNGLPDEWGEAVFRYCTFDGLHMDGLSFDGAMLWCTFRQSEFYWGFFNTAVLVEVRFQDCIFPGTSFRGCRIIDCTFERCRFALSNLGGDCTVDDCTIAGTTFDDCRFEHKPGTRQSIFTSNNRILACSQRGCTGLDGVL